MSDPKYAPFGVDDDPFLTHPAGVGRAPLRGDHRFAQQPMGQRGVPSAPPRLPPAPAYPAYEDAPHHAQHYAQGGPVGAQDPWGQHPPYDPPQPHYQPQYAPQPNPAPQGNFRARGGYRGPDGADYAAPLPQYSEYGPEYGRQFGAEYTPDYGPEDYGPEDCGPEYARTQVQPAPPPRAEPRISAPQPPAQPNYAATPRAPLSAPPRAAQRPSHDPRSADAGLRAQSFHTQSSHTQPSHTQYSAQDYAPRNYAPLPQPTRYAAYDGEGFAAGLMPNPAKLMQMAGAVCTVLALIGAGYWGYALAVRDANGIPVVRAQVDPLRIAPESPGGKVSANQGLAVNSIPAASTANAAPDQITLAPQVAELAPEDTQIIEGGSFAQPAGAGSDAALAGASDQVLAVPQTASGISADLTALPDALPEDMPMTDAEAVERALEAALAEGGDPMLDVAANSAPDAAIAPAEPASMAATDPVAPPTAELDPASIAVGTPMAQLGAFDTADTARAEWANLQTRFTELMAGKSLVVEPAKSGGRDFFRLRAHGFASEDDSRRFCAAILAENGSCFPVDQR